MTVEELVPARTRVALFPKNSGLARQVARIRDRRLVADHGEAFDVRGEDVPFLANELARLERGVVALTGDDLLDEWLAAGNALDERLLRRRIAWWDPGAIYGAPALCLIGAPDVLEEKRPLRVMTCMRYRYATQRFLNGLRDDGIAFETLPIAGSLESCVLSGLADLAIDVVVTGQTIRKAGLAVLRVISTSDVAVLESR